MKAEESYALRFTEAQMTFADGTAAVGRVSLTLAAEEFVSVVGPSGCGKSTLLRMACGLTTPSSGRVDVTTEGRTAFVFQDATLLPWRTVAGNVGLLGELNALPREERDARTSAALELVGLADVRERYPRALSGGMKMRVSLARALTIRPRLFLLDEPFGALDELSRERLNDELLRLYVRERFAALFVTHSVNEAVYLSSRVLVMSAAPGRLVAEFAVPFPFPRDPALRFTVAFGALAAQVSATLRENAAAR